MVKLFSEGFSPAVHKMLEKAPDDDIKIFDLLDMEVLPTWIRGRTALLGDAAHPFLPCKISPIKMEFCWPFAYTSGSHGTRCCSSC